MTAVWLTSALWLPYPVAGGEVTSAAFTPTGVGAYRWVAAYSGDANNTPVTGACNDANETVTVSPAAASLPVAPPFAAAPDVVLPATGSGPGPLLYLAIGLSLTGTLLIGSTFIGRRRRG